MDAHGSTPCVTTVSSSSSEEDEEEDEDEEELEDEEDEGDGREGRGGGCFLGLPRRLLQKQIRKISLTSISIFDMTNVKKFNACVFV